MDCFICLSRKQPLIQPDCLCKTIYVHPGCYKKWLQTTCPDILTCSVCKSAVSVNFIKQFVSLEQLMVYPHKIQEPNIKLSVSHTVSAYNIFYLDEFFTWCYTIGLPRPWLGRVHNPAHMRPTVWPEHTRKIIIEKLNASQHADVKDWSNLMSNHNDSRYFDMFLQKLAQHDQYRQLDFKKTFPELAEHI